MKERQLMISTIIQSGSANKSKTKSFNVDYMYCNSPMSPECVT